MNNSFDFLINNLTPDYLLSWNTILQFIISIGAVGVSFFSNEAIKKYFISKSVKKAETILSGIIRIVSPLVILIILYITNAVLNEYQSTHILDIAITLVNAMIVIRLSIYLIRYIIRPSESIKALENIISIIVWVLVALNLFGVLSLVGIELKGIIFNFKILFSPLKNIITP